MARSDRKVFARINVEAATDTTLIAAPTSGRIEIDHITILASGGANNVDFKSGSTIKFDLDLAAGGGYTYDRTANPDDDGIELTNGEAFVLTTSAATKVQGFVKARVVGE